MIKFNIIVCLMILMLTGCGKDLNSPTQPSQEPQNITLSFYTKNQGEICSLENLVVKYRSYALFGDGEWYIFPDSIQVIVGQGIDLAVNVMDPSIGFVYPLGIHIYANGDSSSGIEWINELSTDSTGNIYLFKIGVTNQGYIIIPISGGTPNFYLKFWHATEDGADMCKGSLSNWEEKLTNLYLPVYAGDEGVKFFTFTRETGGGFDIDTLSFVRAYTLSSQDSTFIPFGNPVELTNIDIPPGGENPAPVGVISSDGVIDPAPAGSLPIRVYIGP